MSQNVKSFEQNWKIPQEPITVSVVLPVLLVHRGTVKLVWGLLWLLFYLSGNTCFSFKYSVCCFCIEISGIIGTTFRTNTGF